MKYRPPSKNQKEDDKTKCMGQPPRQTTLTLRQTDPRLPSSGGKKSLEEDVSVSKVSPPHKKKQARTECYVSLFEGSYNRGSRKIRLLPHTCTGTFIAG